MPTSAQTAGFLPLFKKRAFITMWLAQTISGFGDGVARIALLLLVTEKTSSPVALSIVAFAQAVPAIVLGPVRFGSIVGLAVAGPLAALFGAHRVMGLAGVLALMIGVLGRKSSSYVELNQTTFEVSRE